MNKTEVVLRLADQILQKQNDIKKFNETLKRVCEPISLKEAIIKLYNIKFDKTKINFEVIIDENFIILRTTYSDGSFMFSDNVNHKRYITKLISVLNWDCPEITNDGLQILRNFDGLEQYFEAKVMIPRKQQSKDPIAKIKARWKIMYNACYNCKHLLLIQSKINESWWLVDAWELRQ